MTKYYVLMYIFYNCPNDSKITNVIELDNDIDIYDYLTKVYLKYVKTNKAGKFETLCSRLDDIVKYFEYNKNNIDYEKVYEWIENNCDDDNYNQIIIQECDLQIPIIK